MKRKHTLRHQPRGRSKSNPKKNKNQPEKLRKYIFSSTIGEGASATVYRARNLTNDKQVAIKKISQDIMREDRYLKKLFTSEAAVLKQCNNPNVVKCYETIATRKNLYIVLEYCNGGDLDDYLEDVGRVPERQAIGFLKQILNGFKGLHEVGVMHRDFKLANVLLKDGVCKICDLGFAKQDLQQKKYFSTNTFVHSRAVSSAILGTSVTMAPQVHQGRPYGFEIDVWSIGVSFYQLLYGKYPFDGETDEQILDNIKKQELVFDEEIKVSEYAKDFIRKSLTYNPLYRIKWREIYDHPLINDCKKTNKTAENSQQREDGQEINVISNRKFYDQHVFKQKSYEIEMEDGDLSNEGSSYSPSRIFEQKKYEKGDKEIADKYYEVIEQETFGYNFIDKIVEQIQPLKINHHIPCFLLTKLIYLKLDRIIRQLEQKQNILLLDETMFENFTKTEEYNELNQSLQKIRQEIRASCENNMKGINRKFCPTLIAKQLDLSKILCPNYELLLNQTMKEYEKTLIEHLGQSPQPSKRKHIELILAVRYFKNQRIADVAEFVSAVQSIDMKATERQMIKQYC